MVSEIVLLHGGVAVRAGSHLCGTFMAVGPMPVMHQLYDSCDIFIMGVGGMLIIAFVLRPLS